MAKKNWLFGGFAVGALYGMLGANPLVFGESAKILFKPVQWTSTWLPNMLGTYVQYATIVNILLWGLIGLGLISMLRK